MIRSRSAARMRLLVHSSFSTTLLAYLHNVLCCQMSHINAPRVAQMCSWVHLGFLCPHVRSTESGPLQRVILPPSGVATTARVPSGRWTRWCQTQGTVGAKRRMAPPLLRTHPQASVVGPFCSVRVGRDHAPFRHQVPRVTPQQVPRARSAILHGGSTHRTHRKPPECPAMPTASTGET